MIASRIFSAVCVAALTIGVGGVAAAQSLRDTSAGVNAEVELIQENFSGTRLNFETASTLTNFSLTVTGPDGYVGEVFSARVAPSLRLGDHGAISDGLYMYQVTAATDVQAQMASPTIPGSDGRSPHARPGMIGTSKSGTFQVVNGQIFEFDQAVTER